MQHPHGDVDVTLFVPCYNEECNVAGTLEKAVQATCEVGCTYELFVVDDASRDGSVEVIRRFQHEHPDVPLRLLCNEKNRGLVANYVEAAIQGRGRCIRILCGDDVEPVETQVAILSRMGLADMVIPYPLSVANKSAFRLFLSRLYSRIINCLSGQRLRYWNGCGLFQRADIVQCPPTTTGFGFQAEVLSQFLLLGRSYVEVGCRYAERRSGSSKALTWKNFRSVMQVAWLILRRRLLTETGPERKDLPAVAADTQQVA